MPNSAYKELLEINGFKGSRNAYMSNIFVLSKANDWINAGHKVALAENFKNLGLCAKSLHFTISNRSMMVI